MSARNIPFYDKITIQIPRISLTFVFLSYRKNFLGTQKRVRNSHSKRAIGVRVVEVLLLV